VNTVDDMPDACGMLCVICLFGSGAILYEISPSSRFLLGSLLFILAVLIGSALWENRDKKR